MTLPELIVQLESHVMDKIKITDQDADVIGKKIGEMMYEKINSGEATPELMETTIKAKRSRGYSQPETPLLAEGKYAAQFLGRKVAPDTIEVYNTSGKNPKWPALYDRSMSVLDESRVHDIVQEVLNK